MSTATLPQHEIPLRFPFQRLVFDREAGVYRGALYRTVSKRGRRYEVRDSAKAKTFNELVHSLFGPSDYPEVKQEIYNYARSTEWGRELV